MTDFPTDLAMERLAKRVLDTTLPYAEWTHEAHFALALWLLRHRPDSATPSAVRAIITRLNEVHGTENTDRSGYHHTITIASISAAAEFLRSCPPETRLCVVLERLMGGPYGRSDWIFGYWSREELFSVAARRDWVPPDLKPLPW